MCNRARMLGEPETHWKSAAKIFSERPRDGRFDPRELRLKNRNFVVREQDGERAWNVMSWDALGGKSLGPMTNVRSLALAQWRKLEEKPGNRCLVPLTEFCEFTPDKHDLANEKPPLKGETWFSLVDQPVFAVAGFWQHTAEGWKRLPVAASSDFAYLTVVLDFYSRRVVGCSLQSRQTSDVVLQPCT